jgi:hypothetical protein
MPTLTDIERVDCDLYAALGMLRKAEQGDDIDAVMHVRARLDVLLDRRNDAATAAVSATA